MGLSKIRKQFLTIIFLGGIFVPDRRHRNPEVVLVRRWVTWVSGNLEGGGFGDRVEKGKVSLQAT
jgi:hypothetical protein